MPEVHGGGGDAEGVPGHDDGAEAGVERKMEEDGGQQAQHREGKGNVELLVPRLAGSGQHGGQRAQVP